MSARDVWQGTPLDNAMNCLSKKLPDDASRTKLERIAVRLLRADAPFDSRSPAVASVALVNAAVVRAMLNRGISMVEWGQSALDTLCERRVYRAVFSMLVTVIQVDIEKRGAYGRTPLHVAIVSGNGAYAFGLLAAGADASAISLRYSDFSGRWRFGDCKLWLIYALVACGVDLDVVDNPNWNCRSVRQWLVERHPNIDISPDSDGVQAARHELAKLRLELVRARALAICVGLQSLRINALQLCEILQFACGRVGQFIPFHQWWRIATTVKHFQR